MKFNYYVNSNINFGKNAIEKLPEILEKYNAKTIMLVYDQGVKKASIVDQVLEQLGSKDIKIVIFDGVLPNPSNELVVEATNIAKENNVDAFVGIGGGSSIDLAKAVNILMTNPGPIEQYGGVNKVTEEVLPLIAIPTTAGTSSEVTNVTALTDTVNMCKYVIIDNKIVASDVIIDPEFTRTMPKSVIAATGMDAITHAVESYVSNMSTPLTEYQSLEALKILCKYLPKAIENCNDDNAREQMLLGCVIAGFAFSNANLGLVHGIAHTLSAHFNLSHGMANAALLPYVMSYNAKSCPDKMVKMAEVLGLNKSGDIEIDQYLFSNELKDMIKKIDIKSLSQQGIKKGDLELLANETLKEPVLNFNPRQGITKNDVLDILNQAF